MWLVLAVLPWLLNPDFFMGFFNFLMSIPLFLWLLAQHLRLLATPRLWRAVGLHPEALAAGLGEEAWELMTAELDAPGVVALGEIGLDRRYRDVLPLDVQLAWFRRGLELARARGLPVVLHLVGWHGHALELLRALPPPGGVVHRWSGAVEMVPAFEALGLSNWPLFSSA